MEVISIEAVCLHSVMTTKRVRKFVPVSRKHIEGIRKYTLPVTFWRVFYVPCMLQLAQSLTDEHYTCRPSCSWYRLRVTNAKRTVCAATDARSNSQTLHMPSVLQLVQAPINKHYTWYLCCSWCRLQHCTCPLCCSWCRLQLKNTTRDVSTTASAGPDLWTKFIFYAL